MFNQIFITQAIFQGRFLLAIIFVLWSNNVASQDESFNCRTVDALHYKYRIHLSDYTDSVHISAQIKLKILHPIDSLFLDLYAFDKDGKGMSVDYVGCEGEKLDYVQYPEKLAVAYQSEKIGLVKEFQISYSGIPKTGFDITKNMFGDRVFFADCWPNRAHHWLCCIDDPADKATVEFIVQAPSDYQVVSNGSLIQIEEKTDENITRWRTKVPIPTKVMVIGVAKFAVDNYMLDSIPVSSWVYPQNKKKGFYDYRLSLEPLNYYIQLVGPYPYSKLANVQSTIEYGGMENASCIFYTERSVRGDRSTESLLAHEIAHQWFGNTVTEKDFLHLWLSEGFATYLTDMYFENKYGEMVFKERLKTERKTAITFLPENIHPVVDTTLPIDNGLLSPISYEKAAWFLHMLRNRIGEEQFLKVLKTYFSKFKYSSVSTRDFQYIVDSVSGQHHQQFFFQWLYVPGHPIINYNYEYRQGELYLEIEQKQKTGIFQFALEIEIQYPSGVKEYQTFQVDKPLNVFVSKVKDKPSKIELDPKVKLFFEAY